MLLYSSGQRACLVCVPLAVVPVLSASFELVSCLCVLKKLGNEKTRPMKTTSQETCVALKMKMRMDKSSNTCYDQDSDISFKNDSDEEIDTTAIEEEEWIEYLKKKHEKMKNAKIR